MGRSAKPPGFSSGVSGPSAVRAFRRSSRAARSSLLGRDDREDGGAIGDSGGGGGVEARARPGRLLSGMTSGRGEADDVTTSGGGSSGGGTAAEAAERAAIATVGDSAGAEGASINGGSSWAGVAVTTGGGA